MKVNPNKFQLILFDWANSNVSICVNDTNIKFQCYLKLLGLHCDAKLKCNGHCNDIYINVSRKLNILGRLFKTINSKINCMLFN